MSNIALPIYKSALALAVYMEQIVRGFEKYHKYTIGVDLRQKSKELLYRLLQGDKHTNSFMRFFSKRVQAQHRQGNRLQN